MVTKMGMRCINSRSRFDVKLVSNQKDYLKRTSKLSYISHKMFDNDLVAIHKSKVILTLNKPAYTRMCILDELMHEL